MSKIKWRRPDEKIGKEQIERVQEKFEVVFPDDYVECALMNHGGNAVPYAIDVEGEKRVFATLLSYKSGSCDNILDIFNAIEGRIPKEVFPIACDPAGNYFCLDYRKNKENPQIVYWKHELGVAESDYTEEELKRIDISEVQNRAIQYVCKN